MDYLDDFQKKAADVYQQANNAKEIAINVTTKATNRISKILGSTCSANVVHLSLALTSILMYMSNNQLERKQYLLLVLDLFIILIWSGCIHLFCTQGLEIISWGLVFIPYMLLVIHLLGVVHVPKLFFNIIMSNVQQKIFDIQ
jgi:anaerobic C4-dicarboxylate transporter